MSHENMGLIAIHLQVRNYPDNPHFSRAEVFIPGQLAVIVGSFWGLDVAHQSSKLSHCYGSCPVLSEETLFGLHHDPYGMVNDICPYSKGSIIVEWCVVNNEYANVLVVVLDVTGLQLHNHITVEVNLDSACSFCWSLISSQFLKVLN